MFATPKGLNRTITFALFLVLSGTAIWYYNSRGFLGPTWLPTIPLDHGYEPVLGRHADPARLYFPPDTNKVTKLAIASYVEPQAVRPRTPLFIGFTNNNAMLVQCVLSYIAAGWPASDIIVVENTPTMDSNALGRLGRDNYFFLDHALLRSYGVSILQTPVLFTFSQLQNFFIRTALAHNWPNFFWSHMDVIVVGDEAPPPGTGDFKPFHHRILDVVRKYTPRSDWAIKWFSCTMGIKACDMLVLVNVATWKKIGAWDPFIPYYITDCDAFSRMVLNGYTRKMAGDHDGAGHIFDVGALLEGDPMDWLFPKTRDEQPNSERFQKLFHKLQGMEIDKLAAAEHRNSWQENHGTSSSDDGEWGYDQKAFRAGWWALSDAGRALYDKKWGTDRCELEEVGVKIEDMWKPMLEDDSAG